MKAIVIHADKDEFISKTKDAKSFDKLMARSEKAKKVCRTMITDDLIESLNACVKGDACENCIELETKERFCWVNLMRKSAEALEQFKDKHPL